MTLAELIQLAVSIGAEHQSSDEILNAKVVIKVGPDTPRDKVQVSYGTWEGKITAIAIDDPDPREAAK